MTEINYNYPKFDEVTAEAHKIYDGINNVVADFETKIEQSETKKAEFERNREYTADSIIAEQQNKDVLVTLENAKFKTMEKYYKLRTDNDSRIDSLFHSASMDYIVFIENQLEDKRSEFKDLISKAQAIVNEINEVYSKYDDYRNEQAKKINLVINNKSQTNGVPLNEYGTLRVTTLENELKKIK